MDAPLDLNPSRPIARRWRAVESATVFAVGFAVMLSVYTGGDGSDGDLGVPGHDSFYHVKMAALMPEHGLLRTFPWLRFCYFTDEGNGFVSHHYGFHALLAPFVHASKWLAGDYLPGAKVAMATFFGATLVLFHLLLGVGRVGWRWVWLLGFVLMPYQFFVRHAYVRAIDPSLMFMLLIIWLMFRGKLKLTGLAIAGYIQLYLGGVLYAPLIVGAYFLASAIGPQGRREIRWRLVVFAVAGWAIGLAVHPYSGAILEFLKLQVLGTGLSPDISVGREWKPYNDVWWFAKLCGITGGVWTIALCARLRWGRSLCAKELTLLLLHFVFLGLTLKARRFIEYWPVFCLLSAAFMAGPLVAEVARRCEGMTLRTRPRLAAWLGRAMTAILAMGILGVVYASPVWHQIRGKTTCLYDVKAIRSAMVYLKEHSQPGDVVFTDDWDIFPVYFYYNAYNHYVVGLDPKFTHARRPELWARYVNITRGKVPRDVSVKLEDASDGEETQEIHVAMEDIRDEFGARFVIADRDHKKLASKLADAPDFAELVYPSTEYKAARNEPYLIFRIRQPQKEKPET
ncbi:MAG: hypothetical protein ACE5E5_01980 [Phycisphaerae bacterium]